MNKRTKNITVVVTLILAILLSKIVYANSEQFNKQEAEFFIIDKKQASINETITMTIDLNKITYDNFEFTLNTNNRIEEIELTNNDTKNDLQTTIENNTLTINSSKSQLNLEKIELYYKIPESMQIGNKLSFTATIKNSDNSTENDKNTNSTDNASINEINNTNETINNNSTSENGNETSTVTVEVEIVAKNVDQNNEKINISNQPTQTTSSNKSQNGTVLASNGSGNNSDTSTTYKGSNLNYLTNIEVEGYELTPEFSITNTTYFLTVKNKESQINISTTKYDSSAKVKIYGNTNLKEGQNKVLISVTAENGDVRTYRIYVNREVS